MTPHDEPMRLNKYLAHKGIATRRAADDLIASGKVLVNGKKATLGMQVSGRDVVEIREGKNAHVGRAYVAYHKPRGIVSHRAEEGQEDIVNSLPAPFRHLGLFPVGRLDKESYGLIILTNDGRITDRLLNPNSVHDKEYTVRTKLALRDSFEKHMEAGVDIEGYITKPTKVTVTGEKSFTVTLTEGKKHQIRRMVVALHNEVVDLKRTRIMTIRLGKLQSGAARMIEGDELKEFLSALGL